MRPSATTQWMLIMRWLAVVYTGRSLKADVRACYLLISSVLAEAVGFAARIPRTCQARQNDIITLNYFRSSGPARGAAPRHCHSMSSAHNCPCSGNFRARIDLPWRLSRAWVSWHQLDMTMRLRQLLTGLMTSHSASRLTSSGGGTQPWSSSPSIST